MHEVCLLRRTRSLSSQRETSTQLGQLAETALASVMSERHVTLFALIAASSDGRGLGGRSVTQWATPAAAARPASANIDIVSLQISSRGYWGPYGGLLMFQEGRAVCTHDSSRLYMVLHNLATATIHFRHSPLGGNVISFRQFHPRFRTTPHKSGPYIAIKAFRRNQQRSDSENGIDRASYDYLIYKWDHSPTLRQEGIIFSSEMIPKHRFFVCDSEE